ncbi:MAG: hypothetical protein ACRC28_18575 [Clostridium sp.]|uniref:hypothetical protein n=1 Tax=Clostridium sp. TaxID=1506 RepID=UPI003F2C85A4
MRSYLDIIIDLKDGKEVSKQELGIALLFANDQLFFEKRDIERLLKDTKTNPMILKMIEENREVRFQARKAPMEKWFKSIPIIK